jgi:hypothetical protein
VCSVGQATVYQVRPWKSQELLPIDIDTSLFIATLDVVKNKLVRIAHRKERASLSAIPSRRTPLDSHAIDEQCAECKHA